MDPIYEKQPEDWARRFIAKRLGVRIVGRRKEHQWGAIVACLVNNLDHYDHLREYVSREFPTNS